MKTQTIVAAAVLCLLSLCAIPPAFLPPVARAQATPEKEQPAAAPAEEAAPTLPAPAQVRAADTPNDGGGSITVRWDPVPGADRYIIARAEAGGEFDSLDVVAAAAVSYADESVQDGKTYRYRITAENLAGERGAAAESGPAASKPQWFNGYLLGVALALLTFMALILWFIRKAKKGIHLFVRRIAGLEAVDEAVGRATEMGRPLLYIPGTGYISDIGTVASLNLLGEVAKKTAQYGTTVRVPVRDPIVFTVAREVVKGSYTSAGRPDAYDPESVFFLVENALAYAGAVGGLMVRQKPAANFFMGPFFGESLILAETGSTTGAIQIAGTDQSTQLPFFVVACDYTLIGEELYAASAYIAREPLMLGALKGQDYSKFILLTLLILGTAVSLIWGVDVGKALLSTSGR